MSIYEYDEEKHIRMEREYAWELGHEKGVQDGTEKQMVKIICHQLAKGKTPEMIAEDLGEELEYVQKIVSIADQMEDGAVWETVYEKLRETLEHNRTDTSIPSYLE